ncbi:MAG: fused MFS/spermidine synthase [Steroidobacter sp.]
MTPLFAVTVILGACLLFLVQPLIAKIILPWFGGTSSVWSAALVFFQLCVLGGYSYAHWLTTHVRPKTQRLIHGALLIASCALMPILPSDTLRPTADGEPTLQILWLLTATVGLPALMLSSTSPLLQVWYMRRLGSEPPYWLFAWSNAGSLLALLSFPFVLEPVFTAHTLAWGWSGSFVLFAALSIGVAYVSHDGVQAVESTSSEATQAPPSLGQMLIWVVLAASASGLLVTVSANMSANVAPIPLLWVVPLALYLLTFILAFSGRRFYRPNGFVLLVAAAIGGMGFLYTQSLANWPIEFVIPAYLVSLFIVCLACHGELVMRRPAPRYLTRFYLLISLGGALGGAFVGVIAPMVFATYVEMPVLLIVIAELYVLLQWFRRGSKRTLLLVRIAMIVGVISLVVHLMRAEIETRRTNLLTQRNFYGVLAVRDNTSEGDLSRRHLVHGSISHGYQFLSDAYRNVPSSYFSTHSGVGRTLTALQAQGPVRFGVVGLGVGVMSGYVREGDYVRLYEINPDVVGIADQYFSFLPNARRSGADLQVLLGDARLTMERQSPQQFDLLAIDAFSSDAIPSHLLTNEAFELYFKHLKPDGVLAVHISNRYVDLGPVCARAAEHVGKSATVVRSVSDGMFDTSIWVLVTNNQQLLTRQPFQNAQMYPAKATATFAGWTDQYSSLWPLLNLAGRAHGTK